MRRRGLALLVVAGVLGVLSALAVAFVTLSRLERAASQQRVHLSRALLLARSGVEDALARVTAGQDGRYCGENWDDDAAGTISGYEAIQQVFQPAAMDVESCPVRHAMRPSFFVRAAGNAAVTGVEGKDRGFSGALGGNRLQYVLKVEDESGKINANGGLLDGLDRDGLGVPDHKDPYPADVFGSGEVFGWNDVLVRLLDVLGARPEVGVPGLGTLVLNNRPLGGYRSVAELQALCGIPKDLSPWITVSSWSDASVVKPTGGLAGTSGCYGPADVMASRGPLRRELMGRPPVNLNAAPRTVLAALLEGLQGECTVWNPGYNATSYTLTPARAGAIADAVLDFRRGGDALGMYAAAGLQPGPFRTWGQFSAFVDALVPQVIQGFNVAPYPNNFNGGNLSAADMVKAALDPNACLNKTGPDQLRWRWVDKSDLKVWTTEGSLHPTGAFRISCAGRILSADGRLLAEREASVLAEAFRPVRQTTQEDFIAGRPLGQCFSAASGFPPTNGASASWNAWGGAGPGALSYPNLPTASPSALDGYLALATLELPASDPPTGRLLFLHHYDDSLDADVGSPAGRLPGPEEAKLQTDLTKPFWPPGLASPNTVFPDGFYNQKDRAPSFDADGNFVEKGRRGVISYWTKPLFPAQYTFQVTEFSCVRGNPPSSGHVLYTGFWGGAHAVVAENCAGGADWGGGGTQGYERHFYVGFTPSAVGVLTHHQAPGGRWRLFTAFYDLDEPLGEDLLAICEGALGKAVTWPTPGTYATVAFYVPLEEDLIAAGQVMTVGGGYGMSVMDEFALLNFGDASPLSLNNVGIWAGERFKDGRYYKGDDAVFTSSTLQVPAGSRVLSAAWTAWLPKEDRKEFFRGLLPPTWTWKIPAQGQSRLVDSRLLDATVELELQDAAGATLVPSLAQLGRIDRPLSQFRYRAHFRTDLPDPVEDPALETPILDDVTFLVAPPGGPRILGWGA